MNSHIGISVIEYYSPPISIGVHELAATKRVQTNPVELAAFGFSNCMIADKSASEIAIEIGKKALAQAHVDPEDVGILICAHAISSSAVVPREGRLNSLDGEQSTLDLFRFSSARVQHALGLTQARVFGLSDLGCVSLMQAVAVASELLPASGKRYALCINADVLPKFASREVLHSVISDAGCAVLLDAQAETGAPKILASHQICKGYYWDAEKMRNDLLAAYFPTATRFIFRFLDDQGLTLGDIAFILPNNVSYRSWEILSNLLSIGMDRVYTPNIARCGHSIAADNFINLRDIAAAKGVKPGEKVLLFGFGLGAYWSAMLVSV